MIKSMTGFARGTAKGSWGTLICELKSVNHRYLEMNLRFPDVFRELESDFHKQASQLINRGKIDCFLEYKPGSKTYQNISINAPLVKKMLRAVKEVHVLFPDHAPLDAMDILSWPEVLDVNETDLKPLYEKTKRLFMQSLQELVKVRAREGLALRTVLFERLEALTKEVKKIRQRLPEIAKQRREKPLGKLTELKVELDPMRLEQEIILLLQKCDIAEELDRLSTHIKEVTRVLKSGGIVGRRLDFFLQEFNREANTLAAKSVDVQITQSAVELKVLIEQMREQVQNIE